jgi:SAM-dependent methyltransferase
LIFNHVILPPLKLDLGCGKNKVAADWIGVDSRPFPGVDQVVDLTKTWPWEEGSVDEVNASHVVEHFDGVERVHFVNELYRVLKMGGQAKIITPHWAAARAYGDLTHKWPPVSEFWYYYLNLEWREVNAPHNDSYTCNFAAGWGYVPRADLNSRNEHYQVYAMANYKEACQDIVATLTKIAFPNKIAAPPGKIVLKTT